jgi:hypothetical protein
MTLRDSTVVVEYDVVGLKEKASGTRYDIRKCSVFKTDGNHIISEATYSNTLYFHNTN